MPSSDSVRYKQTSSNPPLNFIYILNSSVSLNEYKNDFFHFLHRFRLIILSGSILSF